MHLLYPLRGISTEVAGTIHGIAAASSVGECVFIHTAAIGRIY